MNAAQILKDAEGRMEKALEKLRNDLKGQRTGRASPGMLDGIRVDYYGSPTPVNQIANVSCPDPSSILIKPFAADDHRRGGGRRSRTGHALSSRPRGAAAIASSRSWCR